MAFLWVCLGGAVGSGLRFLVSAWVARGAGAGFPWGTLTVNLVGSLLLGVLIESGVRTGAVSEAARLGLGAGLLGGFTTFSAFSVETYRFLEAGAFGAAVANAALNGVGSVAAAGLGVVAARRLLS